ncbi:MAG: PIN domain-containing protein [Acidimicrobiia bacterium]|nr:PIN domain-containing protein [Acidimicrobiia bacterium]
MSMILDAGALVALERDDRAMWRRLKAALLSGNPPITHGGVIAQVWRGGSGHQARLARALQAVETVPLDEELGRRAGVLLARSRLIDAIDAALAAMAAHGDQIITSDPHDLAALVAVTSRRIDVVPVS